MSTVSRREILYVAAAAGTTTFIQDAAHAQPTTGRIVELDARPGPLTVNTARAAVLVVDMQNDFGSAGGMFERAGIDISGVRRAIEPTARVLTIARRSSIPVVYLKMAYQPDLSDLGEAGSANRDRHLGLGVGQHVRAPDGTESRILIRDTWNTDIVAELKPHAGDVVIYKTRFSGFYNTELHERLTDRGVKELIVVGCTTSICVESTVRDAMFRDYRCVLLADCMDEPIGAGLARSNHEASLLSTETLLGWVSDSSRLAAALADV
jgi:ureidoacrylate peracid hydrolase